MEALNWAALLVRLSASNQGIALGGFGRVLGLGLRVEGVALSLRRVRFGLLALMVRGQSCIYKIFPT